MEKKISINVPSLLMIYAILAIPLIYTGTASFYNISILILALVCFNVIGSAILLPVSISDLLSPLSNTALSVFTGAFIFSMALFISVHIFFLLASLFIITVLLLAFFRKHTEWSFKQGRHTLVTFVLVLIVFILISPLDFFAQFSAYMINRGQPVYCDSYYYTAIVTSIRRGAINSAAYEINSPLNYQLLSFFIPSMLADLLKISSHQALWGLVQPFYKFLAILLGYEVCYFFLKDKVSRNNYLFILLAVSLPVLLVPLSPAYVLKGAVKDFIYICSAYLTPSGKIIKFPGYVWWTIPTVAWPATMILLLLSILLFSKIDWKNKIISADKILFTLVLGLMFIGKVPLYFSFGAFIGVIIIKRIIFDKEKIANYFPYIFSSFIISYISFKICINSSIPTGNNYFKFDNFYYILWEQPLAFGARRISITLPHVLINIGLILATYIAWTSIRILGLISLIKSKVPKLNEFFTGGVISLFIITVLATFLHFNVLDRYGKVIGDTSFNVQQFMLGSFYIITTVSVIGILYIFYSQKFRKAYIYIVSGATAAWCIFSLIALVHIFKDNIYNAPPCAECDWFTENRNTLKTGKYNDGLIVVNPALPLFGIMIASSDYGTYWTAMNRSDYNWNETLKNDYRWQLFKNLIDTPKEQYLAQMKNEGVKYIIATPDDYDAIDSMALMFPQRLAKLKETRWIYRIN